MLSGQRKSNKQAFRVVRFWDDYVLSDRDGAVAETILEAIQKSALPAHERARRVAEGWVDDVPSPRPSP